MSVECAMVLVKQLQERGRQLEGERTKLLAAGDELARIAASCRHTCPSSDHPFPPCKLCDKIEKWRAAAR